MATPVLSPSTAADDRATKMPVYAAAGVAHAWLIDPLLRTLEVFRLESGRFSLLVTHQGDVTVRAEPFHEADLDMGSLWRPPAKRAMR